MRTALFFLLMIVAGLSAVPAAAQSSGGRGLPLTAEAYFHQGAQAYIGGGVDEAKRLVRQGLQAHPDDAKLQALQEKLEREQQQGGASGGQNQPQDQGQGESDAPGQPDDPGEQDAQQGQPGENGQPDPQEEADPQEQEGEPQEQDEPQQPAAEGERPPEEPNAAPGSQAGTPGQPDANELSRAQAARILEALQSQEEQLLRQVQKRAGQPRRVEKDW